MKTMVEIDGRKLQMLVEMIDKQITDIDESLGHTSGYLKKAIRRNRISASAMVLLETIYGIKPEMYQPSNEHEKEINKPFLMTMEENRLYQIIFTAVSDAMKERNV